MAMPEIAIDENRNLAAWEDEIWFPRYLGEIVFRGQAQSTQRGSQSSSGVVPIDRTRRIRAEISGVVGWFTVLNLPQNTNLTGNYPRRIAAAHRHPYAWRTHACQAENYSRPTFKHLHAPTVAFSGIGKNAVV